MIMIILYMDECKVLMMIMTIVIVIIIIIIIYQVELINFVPGLEC